jgi:hypothetical protein
VSRVWFRAWIYWLRRVKVWETCILLLSVSRVSLTELSLIEVEKLVIREERTDSGYACRRREDSLR